MKFTKHKPTVIRCGRCGEVLQKGDEIIMCPRCHDMVCTKSCIAGRSVNCFKCEESR